MRFLVYAPNAKKIYVVGNFNGWKKSDKYEMQKIDDTGCHIIYIEGLKEFEIYKYLIVTKDDKEIFYYYPR